MVQPPKHIHKFKIVHSFINTCHYEVKASKIVDRVLDNLDNLDYRFRLLHAREFKVEYVNFLNFLAVVIFGSILLSPISWNMAGPYSRHRGKKELERAKVANHIDRDSCERHGGVGP